MIELPAIIEYAEEPGDWCMAADLYGAKEGRSPLLRVTVWQRGIGGPNSWAYKVLWKVGTRSMRIYCDHGKPPPPFIRWQVNPELLEFLRAFFDTFLDLGFPWSAWFLNDCPCGAGTFEPCRSKSRRYKYNRVVHRERGR